MAARGLLARVSRRGPLPPRARSSPVGRRTCLAQVRPLPGPARPLLARAPDSAHHPKTPQGPTSHLLQVRGWGALRERGACEAAQIPPSPAGRAGRVMGSGARLVASLRNIPHTCEAWWLRSVLYQHGR